MTHRDDLRAMDFAGMAERESGRTGLARPAPVSQWMRPANVWLERERVHYAFGLEQTAEDYEARSQRRMFEQFIKLDEVSDEGIVSFAAEWGMLGFDINDADLPAFDLRKPDFFWFGLLREHYRYTATKPAFAYDLAERDGVDTVQICLGPIHPSGGEFPSESLGTWRVHARLARTVLKVVAVVRQGALPDRLEHQNVWRGWRPRDLMIHVNTTVNSWLDMADVRFQIEWQGLDIAQPSLSARNVFGAVAVQLMLAACGSDGMYFCYGCMQAYAPGRKPKSGQRNFCKECRDNGVPQKYAKRDERRK